MNENQIFQQAQEMFLTGSGRKEVMQFLEKNGIPSEKINEETTKAYQAIKDVRKEVVNKNLEAKEKESNYGKWIAGVVFFIILKIILRNI